MTEGRQAPQPRRLAGGFANGMARTLGVAAALMIAACSTVVPKGPQAGPAATPPPPPKVRSGALPEDQRDRVAILAPLSGPDAGVGESIANAATMALIDSAADRVRITTYDTGAGAGAAARKALADGNRLILGPLLAADVRQVAPIAEQAHVPVLSFSNDVDVAGHGVYLLGYAPTQSIDRVIDYAHSRGLTRIAALMPGGLYGRRASNALLQAVQDAGSSVVSMQSYDRSPVSLTAAIRKLGPPTGYDAVLIADTGRIAVVAAPILRKAGSAARLLGTELWNAEPQLASAKPMQGAWFAAVSDRLYAQFAAKYRARYGKPSYRLASLGYDAVLLTVRISADWNPGTPFPERRLTDKGGFAGVDGAFRFGEDGIAERRLDVKQIGAGGVTIVAPAAQGFDG